MREPIVLQPVAVPLIAHEIKSLQNLCYIEESLITTKDRSKRVGGGGVVRPEYGGEGVKTIARD